MPYISSTEPSAQNRLAGAAFLLRMVIAALLAALASTFAYGRLATSALSGGRIFGEIVTVVPLTARTRNIPTSLKLTRACVITAHAMALSVMTEEFTMRGLAYNPGILPAEMIIRQRVKPMPSREELLKRNSFGSVNDNKYLNAMWRKGGKQ